MTVISASRTRNPWLTRAVRIVDILPEIDGVATYRLHPDGECNAEEFHFLPGQFNMLYLPGVGESAISMSGDAETRDGWVHTVRVAGNVTHTLAHLQRGEMLGLRGPFGTGWPLDQLAGHDVVVVAGGLGLAPVRPLIYHFLRHRNDFGEIRLIIGARTPDGLLYQSEYADWKRQGIEVQATVDRATVGWSGHIGVVTVLLDRLPIADAARTQMVSCGPEVMMKYAAATAIHRGIAEGRIWVSLERNMQCAVGFCGHCQLGPAFLCKDGPVLRYDRIHPYLMVESL